MMGPDALVEVQTHEEPHLWVVEEEEVLVYD
jgi:hypothetical protein